ncbi:MAG: phospholipase D-like domain-containing protein [Prochlorotrichaceae cyanobacterium]
MFYDPRSLSTGSGSKACLHTKCVVVDETYVFITSANFTEAAHQRNIETGILMKDETIAKALQHQFDSLVAHKATPFAIAQNSVFTNGLSLIRTIAIKFKSSKFARN